MTIKRLLEQMLADETEFDWIQDFESEDALEIEDHILFVDWERLLATVFVHECLNGAFGDKHTAKVIASKTHEAVAKLGDEHRKTIVTMILRQVLKP